MPIRHSNEMVFLAPRSHETSYDNLQSTIKNGIPYEKVAPFLEENGKNILHKYSKVYAWGNTESLKGSWDLMGPNDFIFFYAKKKFVFASRLLYKQFSENLSDTLWPRSPKNNNKPWSCVFFVKDIRPINVPLQLINELGGYRLLSLQGFQSLNKKGTDEILNRYGSIENFISTFQEGLTIQQIDQINKITNNDELDAKKISDLDSIVKTKDIDEIIAEWQARNLDKRPEEIQTKVTRLKRCNSLRKALKEKHKNQCQICGFTFKTANGQYYSEAAHIERISSRTAGVDTPENILILCPNHHKMLDYGAIKIVSENQVEIEGNILEIRRP